jgi:hypothetical protein
MSVYLRQETSCGTAAVKIVMVGECGVKARNVRKFIKQFVQRGIKCAPICLYRCRQAFDSFAMRFDGGVQSSSQKPLASSLLRASLTNTAKRRGSAIFWIGMD